MQRLLGSYAQGFNRRHGHSRARALATHFAGTYLGCSDAEIGRALGVSRQAILRARSRGASIAENEALTWRDFFEVGADGVEAERVLS